MDTDGGPGPGQGQGPGPGPGPTHAHGDRKISRQELMVFIYRTWKVHKPYLTLFEPLSSPYRTPNNTDRTWKVRKPYLPLPNRYLLLAFPQFTFI